MEVRVLGPLTVVQRDSDAAPATLGPAQRRLLAVLCVNAGQVVSSERIVDMLGLTSTNAVRTTVHRVRLVTGDLIRHEPPGYLIEPQYLDSYRFAELVTQAREASLDTAIGWFDQALSLWRGSAYVEFGAQEWALAEAIRLDELHATTRADRIAALIAQGRITDAAEDAERLIHDQPLRERPRAQLMHSLTLQGRQTEALRSYQDYRSYLIDEAGVEPSAGLAQLERQIATGEIGASSASARASPADPPDERPTAMTTTASVRPTGTVTFLFTDVEGSTRRWENDAGEMSAALARHDGVLRAAIESHGGYVFSTAGDAFSAAFADPVEAVAAAVEAQRSLALAVRMGVHTGTADERDGDYFGPTLNRAARVMGAAHGGQVLLSAPTSELVRGVVDLTDLGEHRLRDLSRVEHLFQVLADGLNATFPKLRTVDAAPGNLTAQATSFVGRENEVKELSELARQHRLVTLTGVGGVGKTRLAIQVAAELVAEFSDGVWLIELAPVGDAASVPDAVATALGVTAQAGRSVTASVAETLAGRQLLVVLDNCEHVLGAAADLIETILAASTTVSIITTSREGLRVGGEYLWPVPSLEVADGAGSAAVRLFVERADAVTPGFSLDNDADVAAVTEICRRLDGIALAIELAAARMVSMTPVDVLARLNDRFRLLSGSQRGIDRHQTLRQAVQWSYDLLTPDEQAVLGVCAVFAGGFDVVAATTVCERFDEYTMLDVLDSLVRKSLVTVSQVRGRTRYGLLETIRQFTEDRLAAASGVATEPEEDIGELRDRHARYFATEAIAHYDIWERPRHSDATDWVDVEFDNLRTGFRWATDQGDLNAATVIAAHCALIAWDLQRFEPVAWAEELLPAAAEAQLPHLPRLYTAASFCSYTGRPEDAVQHAEAASALQADPRYQPFDNGLATYMQAQAHLSAGRVERSLEICTALAAQTGLAHVAGLCGLTFGLPIAGRSDEARKIADETIKAARAYANPFWVAAAYYGHGRAFIETDPARALATLREGLAYTREHRLPYLETTIARELAGVEAVHGDRDQALNLFTASLNSFHQAGNTTSLAWTLASLAVFFNRIDQPEIAAIIYGTTTRHPNANQIVNLGTAVDHLRDTLDPETFDDCLRTGAAMSLTEAVRYSRHHINTARQPKV